MQGGVSKGEGLDAAFKLSWKCSSGDRPNEMSGGSAPLLAKAPCWTPELCRESLEWRLLNSLGGKADSDGKDSSSRQSKYEVNGAALMMSSMKGN